MGDSTPICRCRVLYLGSSVPRQSKDGLQGIQEPLRSLYPSEGALGAKGIDSWLSVWSNGILLENMDENLKQVTRFFPIESLHYCAAVRQVLVPERGNANPEPKFLPLDSPFARTPKGKHPPIFAAILRRTMGIKVLECHVFICKKEAAANALVRCCFHAYADNSYAKQLEVGGGGGSNGGGSHHGGGGAGGSMGGSVYGTLSKPTNGGGGGSTSAMGEGWRSRAGSTMTLNSVGRQQSTGNGMMMMMGNGGGGGGGAGSLNGMGDAYAAKNLYASSADLDVVDDNDGSLYNGDDSNHKVWSGSQDRLDALDADSPYDFYSGGGAHSTIGGGGGSSTIGRTPRARQISAPVPVPSPPKEDPFFGGGSSSTHSNGKKLTKEQQHQLRKAHKLHQSQMSLHRSHHPSLGTQSLSGTLIRPKPVHAGTMMRAGLGGLQGHPPPPPNALIYAAGPGLPPMPPQRQFHTFSHRGYMAGHPVGHPPHPAQLAAMHHHHAQAQAQAQAHHHAAMVHHHQQQQQQQHQQQPPAFMMPQQYATLQSNGKKKKKDKNGGQMMNGNGGLPLGIPVQPPAMYAAYPSSLIGEPRPLGMSSRKLAQSAAAGLDDISQGGGGRDGGGGGGGGNSGAESPGGTGIYRRKGHLNERAFSYSIRQEHRSRSHGSLASLQFNPPDLKKEREIAQMVAALDLNGGPGGANGMDDGNGSMVGNGHHHHHHHHHHQQQQGHSVLANGGTGTFGKPRR